MSTTFNSLPPELLEVIFQHATTQLSPSERDRSYSTFALVNTNFRNSSQRLLFNRLTILGR